nr:GntR family transcriptional regulator [Corynebacterium sp. TAE3-ERU12]
MYSSIASELRQRIRSGEYPAGHRLPTERELCSQLGVARSTVRQALDSLEVEGLVTRRRGRGGGTVVLPPAPLVELTDIRGFMRQLYDRGHKVTSTVLLSEKRVVEAEEREALRLNQGAEVWVIHRLSCIDDVPILVERSQFPVALFPDLLDHNITASLYGLMRDTYHRAPESKTEHIEPGLSDAEEAHLFSGSPRGPVLRIRRTSFDSTGEAVEYSVDTFRSNRLRMCVQTGENPAVS